MSPLIALIEDDQSIRDMYKLKLELHGYRVLTANNGSEGFKLAKTQRPDLILLDLRMPVMSGDEMLTRLRETGWGNTMPVIVLTNISKSEAPMGLRFLHVERYIVKAHSTPTQVVEIVAEVLAKNT